MSSFQDLCKSDLIYHAEMFDIVEPSTSAAITKRKFSQEVKTTEHGSEFKRRKLDKGIGDEVDRERDSYQVTYFLLFLVIVDYFVTIVLFSPI